MAHNLGYSIHVRTRIELSFLAGYLTWSTSSEVADDLGGICLTVQWPAKEQTAKKLTVVY